MPPLMMAAPIMIKMPLRLLDIILLLYSNLMKFLPNNFKKIAPIAAAVVLIGLSVAGAVFVKLVADKKVAKTNKRLVETSAELDVFKSRDEYLINQSLEASISAVKTTFTS